MTLRVGVRAVGYGIGLTLLLVWFSGAAVAAPTPVGNCTMIDTPGAYEVVTDISDGTADPCIRINASDVDLDGAGHAIDGAGSGNGTGIDAVAATGLSNVTVRNVTVTEFGTGIRLQGVSGGLVADATASNNAGIGVLLRSSPNATINDSTVASNGREGVRLTASPTATLDDVQITGNANSGINVASGSASATIMDGTIADNHVGISVTGSDDAHVGTTTVENNSLYGVSLEGADGTHLASVTATDNGAWALYQGGAGTTTTEGFELDSATVDTTSASVALGPIDQSTAPPSGKTAAGGRVNATDTGAGAYMLLNMSYATTVGVDESTLRLWRHDGSWSQLPAPNGVDTVDDYVYANVTSFPGPPAEYAALGDDSTAPTATPTTPTPTPTPTPTSTPVGTAGPTTATPVPADPVPVDDCVDIDQPGVYELQQDLLDRPEGICIDILVGGVTFDGNGHTIESDGSSSTAAIRAGDFSGASSANVVVRDVEVRDWYQGVWFHAVDGGAISDVTSTNQTIGVAVEEGAAIAVADVTGTDSGGPHPQGNFGWHGGTVSVYGANDSTVRRVDSAPVNIAEYGVAIGGSSNVSVEDVTMDGNHGSGVLVDDQTDSRIENVHFQAGGSTWHGFNVIDSSGIMVRDATVEDVGLNAITTNADDSRIVNVTSVGTGQLALMGEDATNLTVRELHLGAASTPTTVDATGDRFDLEAVPSPPADPGGERNLSRYVEVGGNGPSVLVNVTYTVGDVSTADVDDTTIDPWLYDGSWNQATGTAGTNTAGFYVYANVTSAGVIVAPLGEEGSGASISTGTGFGSVVALVAVLAVFVALLRRPGSS